LVAPDARGDGCLSPTWVEAAWPPWPAKTWSSEMVLDDGPKMWSGSTSACRANMGTNASDQGLTLVHFQAQLQRFVWDRGCA